MQVIIYMDTFFLVNLCMNVLVLTILHYVTKQKTGALRLLAAGSVGAVGACILIVFPRFNSIIKFIFTYMILNGVMVWISFSYEGLRKLIKNIIELYLITFLLGGVLTFLYYNTDLNSYMKESTTGSRQQTSIGISVLLVGMTVVILMIPILIRLIQSVKTQMNRIYDVTLSLDEQNFVCKGLLDTGNLLRDPITQKPVVIAEYDSIKTIIPFNIDEYTTRLKVIPYHALGNENGVLYGLVFDKVDVIVNGKLRENKNVIVGLYHGQLSSKHEYQLILHEELLEYE